MPIQCVNVICPYCQQGECGRRSQNDEITVFCMDRLPPKGELSARVPNHEAETSLLWGSLVRYVVAKYGEDGVQALARIISHRQGRFRQ